MAALVQSFPSPTSTLTMLQTRPSSAEAFQNGPQSQQHQRNPQMPRNNIYHSSVGSMAGGNYRGHTSISPGAPYTFTNAQVTPNTTNPLRQHPTVPLLRQENRTLSAPTLLITQQNPPTISTVQSRQRLLQSLSPPLPVDSSNTLSLPQQMGSKDDTSIQSGVKQNHPRPLSTIDLNVPSLSTTLTHPNAPKPSPDRYRRNHRRAEPGGSQATGASTQGGSAPPSGSGMATIGHLYNNPTQSSSTPTLTSYPSFHGSQVSPQPSNDAAPSSTVRLLSSDDMSLPKQSAVDLAKRYRRRSTSSLEMKEHAGQLSESKAQPHVQQRAPAATLPGPAAQERAENQTLPILQRSTSSHGRNHSTESASSSRSGSRPSSVSTDNTPCPWR